MHGMKIGDPTKSNPGGKGDVSKLGSVSQGNPNATGKTNHSGPGGGH